MGASAIASASVDFPPGSRPRCATGIEGLDNILGGGIPSGNTVLVAGSVGTGKTTLSLEFLVRGAERGERSIFFSVTEAASKLVENLAAFEFFRRDLVERGDLVFVDVPQVYDKLGLDRDELGPEEVDLFVRALCGLAAELGARRAVLDSVTSVGYRFRREERVRDFVLRMGQGLGALGCTSLFISETSPSAEGYSARGVEEAIVDGVIQLGNARRRGDILRILQVIKMRGTAHSRAQYVMELTPIGLLLAPHLKGGRGDER